MDKRLNAIERYVGRRALRATLRFTWNRFAIRAQLKPLRSVTLVGLGGVVGLIAGWLAGRRTAPAPPPPRTPPAPPPPRTP
jgi:hypothetical protein